MQWDAVLTPALAQRPLRIGELDTCAPDPMATFDASSLFTPYTPFVNVTGQPAISLPMYEGEDGLPLGVQLIGGPLSEGLLLSIAAQLEVEQNWQTRKPKGLSPISSHLDLEHFSPLTSNFRRGEIGDCPLLVSDLDLCGDPGLSAGS